MARKFSYIHHARFKKVSEKDWLDNVVGAIYGWIFEVVSSSHSTAYFIVDDHRIQLGAVYCMYLLHATQPSVPPISLPLPVGQNTADNLRFEFTLSFS